jgi:class 3 adenylate cyclase
MLMVAPSAEPVTFLLTDIEGSTRVLARAGDRYPRLVAEHRAIIDAATAHHGGAVVSTQGDSCLATFPAASAALRAAVDVQRRLEAHVEDALRVRIGIHSGQAVRRDGEYFGMDLHLAARITDAGHGGQVLVSEATQRLVGDRLNGARLRDLGQHRLKGLAPPRARPPPDAHRSGHRAGVADGGAAPTALVVEALRHKAALLILDNFEHLLDAAGAVSSIVEACPGVCVLATSRERLNLGDEQVYPVSPLSLDSDAAVPSSDAVALFVDRARFHDPAFAPTANDLQDIAAICRRVAAGDRARGGADAVPFGRGGA